MPVEQLTDHGRATFTVQLDELEAAKSGSPDDAGAPTVRGHAAVFNRLSHDLGGYRVKIAGTAFDKVLEGNPDVHLVWDHNTRYTLARTKNKTLELRVDPYGLHVWARMANTSTAKELATLMEGGYIDQMSFACDIGASEWSDDEQGNITRTIHEIDALYDVTICAQGAFPQTDAQLVASLKDAGADLASAIEAGLVTPKGEEQDKSSFADHVSDSGAASVEPEAGTTPVAQETAGGRDLAAFKRSIRARYAQSTHPE
jgi:HK97 family phage prohead protease